MFNAPESAGAQQRSGLLTLVACSLQKCSAASGAPGQSRPRSCRPSPWPACVLQVQLPGTPEVGGLHRALKFSGSIHFNPIALCQGLAGESQGTIFEEHMCRAKVSLQGMCAACESKLERCCVRAKDATKSAAT